MRFKKSKSSTKLSAVDVLLKVDPTQLTIDERIALTTSCDDASVIPKVKNAGKLVTRNGKQLQVMHNGLLVLASGYYGALIQPIIQKLRGHHEPQEEKVYYELLKRINSKTPAMIELGSHWSYYSLWFKHDYPNGLAVCCEPDPHNISVGRENAELNKATNMTFHQTLAGAEDGKLINFTLDSNPNEKLELPIRTVDSLCAEHKMKQLDILHVDTQGAELNALRGAVETIRNHKLRFVVISTHHYIFSGLIDMHERCEKFILDNGGFIISSHDIPESFSGDGLIVASFDKRDKDFKVDISHNYGRALFRSAKDDLKILAAEFDKEAV